MEADLFVVPALIGTACMGGTYDTHCPMNADMIWVTGPFPGCQWQIKVYRGSLLEI